jgi:hypothetical protein
MSRLPEEKPTTLMSWFQLFGILISVTVIAFMVVGVFSLVFGASGAGP